MQSWVQGIDETPCAMICPEIGRTRSAYLYAQYGDSAHPYMHFAFASHKDEENVRRIAGTYEGYLQSDAYICYELIVAASANRIIAVGCRAYAGRKFEPLIDAGPHPQAAWILGEIQKLYDIEDRARDMTDDNRTEAVIKGPVMGKKAWLFFGNEQAGETAAVFYTLTMTCKRHCIDVQAYLLDVFRRRRTATPAELESLLPDRWIQTHPEARVVQRVQESHAAAARKRQRRARRRSAVPSG